MIASSLPDSKGKSFFHEGSIIRRWVGSAPSRVGSPPRQMSAVGLGKGLPAPPCWRLLPLCRGWEGAPRPPQRSWVHPAPRAGLGPSSWSPIPLWGGSPGDPCLFWSLRAGSPMGSFPYLAGGSGQGSQHPAMWLVPSHPAHSAWPPACALPPPAVVLPSCVPGCRSFGGRNGDKKGKRAARGAGPAWGLRQAAVFGAEQHGMGAAGLRARGAHWEWAPSLTWLYGWGHRTFCCHSSARGVDGAAGTCVEWRGCRGAGGGLRAAFTPSRDLAALVIPGVGGWDPPVCIQEQQRGLGLPTGGSQRGRDHSISSANQTPLFLFFFFFKSQLPNCSVFYS